jgi:hypothetical protein
MERHIEGKALLGRSTTVLELMLVDPPMLVHPTLGFELILLLG